MNLKELRVKSGYFTQKDFAKAIGNNVSTVSMWETGNSSPRIKDIPKIAEALRVPVEILIKCFIENEKLRGSYEKHRKE